MFNINSNTVTYIVCAAVKTEVIDQDLSKWEKMTNKPVSQIHVSVGARRACRVKQDRYGHGGSLVNHRLHLQKAFCSNL